MRGLRMVLLVGGLVLFAALITHVGADAIIGTLARLSWWGLVLACLPHGLATAIDTLGWRYAFARDRVRFSVLLGARVAGEALNVVTALASVGGEAVKTWLVRREVAYEESVPSVVIAKTTITIAQGLFLLLGIVVGWLTLSLDSQLVRGMLWLLLLEVLGVGGFVLAQVSGVVARGGRLLRWLGVIDDPAYAERLDAALRHFYLREWQRLGLSIAFHFLGWLAAALEAFVILWLLGVPVSLSTAATIEALGSGVRFATFMVPASVGALEAANAAAFVALGWGAGAGLAFSLVRRARQVVWVGLGLVALALMRSGASPSPAHAE